MTHIIGESTDDLYRELLANILWHGKVVKPRGQETRELIGVQLELNRPEYNILSPHVRKPSYHFMVAEFLWILLGMNDLAMIQPYNAVMRQFSDDGETLAGAYGPKLLEQLPYVLQTLTQDPESRQAVISIWQPRPRESRDIPCTVALQFLIRGNDTVAPKLEMVTFMRSNDAWLGLPYDIFTFTMIQRYVALRLGVGLGTYHHMVGSMHLYEKDLELAALLAHDGAGKQLASLPRLSMMPPEFRSTFIGLTLMARKGKAPDDSVKGWLQNILPGLDTPWQLMLDLLAHRFHKDDEYVNSFWHPLLQVGPF